MSQQRPFNFIGSWCGWCSIMFIVPFTGAGRPQLFCSLRCSQQARTQRFREKFTTAQLREMRHQEYLTKLKAKGVNVRQVRRNIARKVQIGTPASQ